MLNLSIQTNIDKMKTITDFVFMLIEELKQSGRYGTARSYSSSIKRLNAFIGYDKLTFHELTPELLKNMSYFFIRRDANVTQCHCICVCSDLSVIRLPDVVRLHPNQDCLMMFSREQILRRKEQQLP